MFNDILPFLCKMLLLKQGSIILEYGIFCDKSKIFFRTNCKFISKSLILKGLI